MTAAATLSSLMSDKAAVIQPETVAHLFPCASLSNSHSKIHVLISLTSVACFIRVVLPGAGANRFRPTAGGVCP